MEIYLWDVWVFIVGLCIGSFLNVCIYRLPLKLSIVTPRSRCPRCETPIAWYDNVPLLGYILLGGRCRQCRLPIGIRYPLVELLAGIIAVLVFQRFGFTAECAVYFVFILVLLTLAFIDMDHRILPDIITLPGIPLFFLASFLIPQITVTNSLLGIAVGGGTLYLVAWGYYALTGQEGMGGGDIKLLAMIGAAIGWVGVLFTIFAASLIGCIIGLFLMIKSRRGMKLAIPFGPFLSLGATLYLFLGAQILSWYFNLLQ